MASAYSSLHVKEKADVTAISVTMEDPAITAGRVRNV